MKKSRFSEEQIVGVLREVPGGTNVKTHVRKAQHQGATPHYNWKRKYGGMEENAVQQMTMYFRDIADRKRSEKMRQEIADRLHPLLMHQGKP